MDISSASEGGVSLNEYRVKNAPNMVYYIPNFVTEEEGKYLLNQVYTAPKPKWTQLSNRRLQNWGGLPHPKGMIAEELPKWLDVYANKIAGLGVFGDHIPNHVLVNEYQSGQGIMPHEDGPLFYPVVSTISLGSHTFLEFYKKREMNNGDLQQSSDEGIQSNSDFSEPCFSLLLEPCSLLILQDSMYTDHLHGIAERTTDIITSSVANLSATGYQVDQEIERTCRVSLTIRYFPKTLKFKLKFGKR
ncbi:alpha-ketoglutarate-dependent dioxygenase alkB homolog 6-like isoform X1 [Lytechinus variegatus]|uniref:alpha-ketoglutarate-dependent dioxygenase alkB homolog 6-like isoform X1 n=2 Tax=Lytechinus variegatus TaxID=7654 RepID=UPI001BB26015|nr:alpha-ketoglutarate-dependent dioxygenase alkB homolog 6-like isoform X1 [Lytechinus variegatus]